MWKKRGWQAQGGWARPGGESGEGERGKRPMRRVMRGSGLDLVLMHAGRRRPRQRAFDLCRPGGTVVLLGMAKGRSELEFGASIRKEHRVLMSFGYTTADFKRSLELLVAGEIELRTWTVEMPLGDGQAAFEQMSSARGDTLKMMLRVR